MSNRIAALLSLANNELLNENEYSMKKLKAVKKWQKINLRENLIIMAFFQHGVTLLLNSFEGKVHTNNNGNSNQSHAKSEKK